MSEPCVFCEIAKGRALATIVASWVDAVAFVPLNPVTEGHVLVISRVHVQDFTTNPEVTASTMLYAAELASHAGQPMNLITSKGPEATQSVFHLHVHLVPRSAGDGLNLPWTGQEKSDA